MVTIRTVFSCVASRNREAARPRASATPEAPRATVHCLASAATGSAGRRSRREAMPTACTSATAESTRRTVVAMRTVFSCVASRNREAVRPRASATADGEPELRYMTSVTTGTSGRRSRREAMPAACTSTTAVSAHRASITVRTVFRCVASRNREAARPRASATPEAPRATVHCLASATTGSAGRRSRRGTMPAA